MDGISLDLNTTRFDGDSGTISTDSTLPAFKSAINTDNGITVWGIDRTKVWLLWFGG